MNKMETPEPLWLLDPAAQPWMTAPGIQRLLVAVRAAGGDIRFVGGAVRDALLGRKVEDVDLACTLPPESVAQALETAGIKSVPTGVAHGTITAVIDHKGYEITTLRKDVETFGRHATVTFTDDWAADAARRDFTLNALYADETGLVYDYVGGLDDLRRLSLRFIGTPEDRIREDVLRILRFFRFLAQLTPPGTNCRPDPEALSACAAMASLLPTLSAERVWKELSRLLLADSPVSALKLMAENGILPQILPEAEGMQKLERLIVFEKAYGTKDAVRRLAALLPYGHEEVAQRLRLSRAESERLIAMAELPAEVAQDFSALAIRQRLYDHGIEKVRDALFLLSANNQIMALPFIPAIEGWQRPVFPIKGQDLSQIGVPPGPRMGEILKQTEQWWREQDFAPDREACLTFARSLI